MRQNWMKFQQEPSSSLRVYNPMAVEEEEEVEEGEDLLRLVEEEGGDLLHLEGVEGEDLL